MSRFLCCASSAASSAALPLAAPSAERRAELEAASQSELRKRATAAGASPGDLDAADDAVDTKASLVQLILAKEGAALPEASEQLRSELTSMKQSALRKRALSAGIAEAALELCDDASDTKAAIVDLIIVSTPGGGGGCSVVHEAVPPTRGQKPHQGKSSSFTPAVDMPGKHCMISYSWDDQAKAIKIREALQARKVNTWMDIDGGMEVDIYDSMAKGVCGASCIVALLSQSYADSDNCTLEMKFAKQENVPIIPVYVQDGGWKASGWLGLLTAGQLWVQYQEDDDSWTASLTDLVHKNLDSIPSNVVHAVPASSEVETLRQELNRIRTEMMTHGGVVEAASADGLANVPAEVPPVRSNMVATEMMRNAKASLLVEGKGGALSVSSMANTKVGAFGMGGIGKVCPPITALLPPSPFYRYG